MRRFLGASIFGVLALAATLFAVSFYSAFGALLLLGALPLWLLFIVFLLRAARP
jgi:ABC-type transport system involved in cytochrome bd biosynthesis fused ATPase/permease subunit